MLNLKYYLGITVIALMLCGFLNINHENDRLSKLKINEEFYILQQQYFEKLDFRAPQKNIKTIPKFAAELSDLASRQQADLATNSDLSKKQKEQAGLIFIYDAMLTMNNDAGVIQGKVSLDDLIKEKRFAKSTASPKEELKARALYAISQIEKAAKLRPDDHRIDSWLVAARAHLEKIETGKISTKTHKQILQAISARPSFNLWTAILNLHNENEASLDELAVEAKKFVDAADKGQDACTIHPEDCLSGSKAPYNLQAAILELGDVFLKRAEFYLQKGDMQNAMMMAEYAKGTYAQLDKPGRAAITQKWPDHVVIALRKERLAKVLNSKLPSDSLVSMDQYQRAYECSSCHGRVK